MAISVDFARLIGATAEDEPTAPRKEQLIVMLDWALHWAKQGLQIFPSKQLNGGPLTCKHWHEEATDKTGKIVQWWAEYPEADIGCVPGKSGYFILAAIDEQGGIENLEALEEEYSDLDPDLETDNRWGDRFLWFKGNAPSNYQGLGRGLYVIGQGHYVYLPPSKAPAPRFAWQIKGAP